MTAPAIPAQVGAVFDAFPPDAREGSPMVRSLILGVTARTPEAGRVAETLRWGQPAAIISDCRTITSACLIDAISTSLPL